MVARRPSGTDLGAVQVDGFDPTVLEERDLLIVDNIADGGTTLRAVLELVELAETRTVRTAVLVNKQERRRQEVRLDYVGFEVERGWVVCEFRNRMRDPGDGSVHEVYNYAKLHYAGNGRFNYQRDAYDWSHVGPMLERWGKARAQHEDQAGEA